MLKRFLTILLCLMIIVTSAVADVQYQKYNVLFYDTFDTVINFMAYSENETLFNEEAQKVHELFIHYNELFDKYNSYSDINNIYTLNSKAAESPVVVDDELFELLVFCKEMQKEYNSKLNISMGTVLKIWHEYREDGTNSPATAQLPQLEDLRTAAEHINIEDLILNEDNKTVFFNDSLLQIDVSAVAKGFATEKVAQYLYSSDLKSFIISAGGNVRVGQPPNNDNLKWKIGIQNPKITGNANDILKIVSASNASIVTSGDYQRYYTVDGKNYNHIIDNDSLMPAENMHGVSVITENSAYADFLSTTLFLISVDSGINLVNSLDNVEAIWIDNDYSIKYSNNFESYLVE